MIGGILVGGFKAIVVDRQYIRIRPVTQVFGANWARKSSLLHLLTWMHEMHCGSLTGNPLIRSGIGLREGHP